MYHFVLYLHLLALVLAFFATGMIVTGTMALRRAANVDDARFALGLSAPAAKLHPASALALFATGAYMTQTAWSWTTPWIVCGIAGLLAIAGASEGIMGRRERALQRALGETPGGPIPPELHEQLNDPAIAVCGPAVTFLMLGILFLMVVKPALSGSVLTLIVSVLAGVATGYASRPSAKPAEARPRPLG